MPFSFIPQQCLDSLVPNLTQTYSTNDQIKCRFNLPKKLETNLTDNLSDRLSKSYVNVQSLLNQYFF